MEGSKSRFWRDVDADFGECHPAAGRDGGQRGLKSASYCLFTGARDVLDLDLLLRRYPLSGETAIASEDIEVAIGHALELPFDAFRDQVLPFLEPGVASDYEDPTTWAAMQTFVAGELEKVR